MKQKVMTYLPKKSPVERDRERVCILINSIYFFVGSVFISDLKGNYRLIANHNGKILFDKSYPTLRGAKIAFSKLFGPRSWRENVKAEWSDFYDADANWLDARNAH
jgi:hypothetical protein